MHPRKQQNPNRGKRHAAKLLQRETRRSYPVTVSYRLPEWRDAAPVPYWAR